MTSGVMKQDPIILGCAQIRWFLERSAEIYPRIATKPVGGAGLKYYGIRSTTIIRHVLL